VRVAERLASSAIPNVHAIASGPAPENATAEVRRLSPSHLIIVDAADLREAPGTVRLVPRDAIEGASFGTHGLPLSVLAGYLEAEVGCAVIFIGIQPASLAFGEDLSPEVAAAVQETLQVLRECLTPPPSAAPAGAS
jgi:hydrogenase 3 maturation protease